MAGCTYELYHFPDLANLYILSLAVEAGHEVEYLDASLEKLSDEAFLGRIARAPADYFVIHSVILSKRTDRHYIERILALCPQARIVVHGPEPTRVPEEYLLDPRVLVFRGELERNLFNYLETGECVGVSLLEDGRPVHYPPSREIIPFDELPFPFRDHRILQPYLEGYFNPKFRRSPYTIVMTSRGCSFRCRFCVPNSISFAREQEYMKYFGRKPPVSMAGAPRVIEEFRRIKEQGFNAVMVIDDQFLWGEDRTLEICRGIEGLDLEWGCLSRADFLVKEEIVAALARAGCVSIDVGAETLNQSVMDYIRKDMKVETVEWALSLLKRHGISCKLNIMLGTSPLETEEIIEETIERVKELGVEHVMFSIATPFKGTEFYEYCKTQGYLVDESDEINPLGKSVISYPGLSGEDLERLEKHAYLSFYLRPQTIIHRIRSYRRARDFLHDIRVAANLVRSLYRQH